MSWLDHITTLFNLRKRIFCAALVSMNEENKKREVKREQMQRCLAEAEKVNDQLKQAAHETKAVAADVTLKLNKTTALICAKPKCDQRAKPRRNGAYSGPERRNGSGAYQGTERRTKGKRRVKGEQQQPQLVVTV